MAAVDGVFLYDLTIMTKLTPMHFAILVISEQCCCYEQASFCRMKLTLQGWRRHLVFGSVPCSVEVESSKVEGEQMA